MRRWTVLSLALLGAPAFAAPAPAPGLEELMAAHFNPAHYALGYEVYLNNGNVVAAYRVAERAVQHRPDDMEWRRRLATVARWRERPEVALDNWLAVAQQTDADDAWAAVRELAGQLFDHEAWLAVQQREARRHPDDGNRLDDVVLAYEQLGRPEDGLAFLEALAAAHPTRALLAARARLAERSGQPERALAALRELIRHHAPPEEDWLVRAAALHYERGELESAWALLAGAAAKMPRRADRYWQVYGHLSHLLGKEKSALAAYGHLNASGKAGDEDLIRYSSLLQKEKPAAAAVLQARLFQRSGSSESAAVAVYLWTRAREAQAAEKFLGALTPAQLAALEAEPVFRAARGDLRLLQGRWQDALADYEAALRLAPGQSRAQQAWLALMIEHGEPAGLPRLLLEGAPAVDDNPGLASAWAAGWLRLDEPAQALPYLRIAHEQAPNDLLKGLAYADGLARAGYPDDAILLRRTLWARRPEALAAATPLDRPALEQALLDVELAQLPVDARAARLRALLQAAYRQRDPTRHPHWPWLRAQLLDDATEGEPQRLAWLLNRLPSSTAGEWPAVSLALAGGDASELAALLKERGSDLPATAQVEVAQRLGRPELATRLAFAGAERQPGNEALQQQLQELAWDNAAGLDLVAQHDRQGSLQRRALIASAQGRQRDPWRWHLQLEAAQLDSRDEKVLLIPEEKQQLAALGVSRQERRWRWQGQLTALDGLDSAVGALVAAQRAGEYTLLGFALGANQRSVASAGLIAGGMQDEARLTLGWQASAEDYLELTGEFLQFRAQDGSALGTLTAGSAGYRRRLTTSAGGWHLQAGATLADTRMEQALPAVLLPLLPPDEDPDPGYFVPAEFQQYRVALAFGTEANAYRPYWQPFGEIGATDDRDSGSGYDFRVGIFGPLLGEGRLQFLVEGARSAQSNQERRLLVNVSYSLRY